MKNSKSLPLVLAAGLAFSGQVNLAVAQTAPTAGDLGRQVAPIDQFGSTTQAGVPDPSAMVIEPQMTALPGGPSIQISKVTIVGNRELSLDDLAPLVADASGKSMTLADLEKLAVDVTKFYRVKGYFVARAYIPAQEIIDGVLKLRVVEGNYGEFILQNESLAKDEVVQGILDDVRKYDIVSLDTLERAMLIANDTPGVQVTRADVLPGQKVGTSDFAVGTVATPRYTGSVLVDNFGSAYTGRNRLSFNLNVNSPTGRGDRLSASGMVSQNTDLKNLRLAYSTLLQPNGLRGEIAVAQTNYVLGSTFANLNAYGSARSLDATLSYPVKRTRNTSVELTWGFNSKELNDVIGATNTVTPKSLKSTTVGLSYRDERNLFGQYGLTQASAAITFGSLNIRDGAALAADAAGAQTQGGYAKFVASASRAIQLSDGATLTGQLRIQQSLNSKNLDSSERMGVSGMGGVMAYPMGELSGTNARFASIEYARQLPSIEALPELAHSWSAFAEWGQAGQAKVVTAADAKRSISDIGLSWSGNWKSAVAKVYVVHRLQDTAPVSEPAGKTRILAQVGWVF